MKQSILVLSLFAILTITTPAQQRTYTDGNVTITVTAGQMTPWTPYNVGNLGRVTVVYNPIEDVLHELIGGLVVRVFHPVYLTNRGVNYN